MVTFDYHQLEQITSRVRDNLTIANESFFSQVPCCNLSRLDPNHFDWPRFPSYAQIRFAHIPYMYCTCDAWKSCGCGYVHEQLTVAGYQHAIFVDGFDAKGVQVVQHHQVSDTAGGDGAAIVETKILRG